MKLRGFLVGAALALALALTGCGGGSTNSGGSTGSGGGSGAVTNLTIGTDTGAELKFVPNTAQAPANTPVKLTFDNKSTQPHNLTFQEGISAKTADTVAPGSSETISFTTPAAGSYKWVCTLHPGMEGTLTVK